MAYIMLQHYADLALAVWIMCKCYLTLIFQCITARGLLGLLAEVHAALSLKASRDNEICFPKTEKNCVCMRVQFVCVSHHHTWLAQVCELYMPREMILFYSRKMEK